MTLNTRAALWGCGLLLIQLSIGASAGLPQWRSPVEGDLYLFKPHSKVFCYLQPNTFLIDTLNSQNSITVSKEGFLLFKDPPLLSSHLSSGTQLFISWSRKKHPSCPAGIPSMEKAKARTTAFIRLASTILLVECLFLKMSPFNVSFFKNLSSYISKRENSGMDSKLLDYIIHKKTGLSWWSLLYHMDSWNMLQPKSGDCLTWTKYKNSGAAAQKSLHITHLSWKALSRGQKMPKLQHVTEGKFRLAQK